MFVCSFTRFWELSFEDKTFLCNVVISYDSSYDSTYVILIIMKRCIVAMVTSSLLKEELCILAELRVKLLRLLKFCLKVQFMCVVKVFKGHVVHVFYDFPPEVQL